MKWVWMLFSGLMTANFAFHFATEKPNSENTAENVAKNQNQQSESFYNFSVDQKKNNYKINESVIEFRIRETGTSKPIAYASITIENCQGISEMAFANEMGNCKSKLKTGCSYQCLVTSQGYEQQTEEIELDNDLKEEKEVVFISLIRIK